FFYVRLTIWRQHLSKGEIQFPREMCENVQCGEDLPELDRANVRSSEVWRGQVRLAQASGDTQLADVRAHTVGELAARGRPTSTALASSSHAEERTESTSAP